MTAGQGCGRSLAAAYARLSREDGDKLESDSILNQQRLIEDFCAAQAEIELVESYSDDGFTGTNFQRPGFQRMITAIESGKINCVIVKDLSRFGRDYIDMGYYLERYFPAKGVRFIAINDRVDSQLRQYDMMLPLKNVFNTQYAKDISEKVRSAFRAKQRRGEFIGAFAAYGYRKDPQDHNRLIPDPVASEVVLRIFRMAAAGCGQIRIARVLNEERIPCPSAYKRMMGEKYANNHRLEQTTYWTYATVHSILKNELYRGNMVANRCSRASMHGKARKTPADEVIVVRNTHEAIVDEALWDAVQALAAQRTRPDRTSAEVHVFAGLIRCGDCGRAMCRKTSNASAYFCCGSYVRYGPAVCAKHTIREEALTGIVLSDLNKIIASAPDLDGLVRETTEQTPRNRRTGERHEQLEDALSRIRRLKKSSYEDYCDRLLSREEFRHYKAEYDEQERTLKTQLRHLAEDAGNEKPRNDWAEKLLAKGRLEALDRATAVQTIEKIEVFANRRIEIRYRFGDEMKQILEPQQ